MDALLGLTGLAGIIYGIVAMIIAKRKHFSLKKPGIILIVGSTLFFAGVLLTPPDNNSGTGTEGITKTPDTAFVSPSGAHENTSDPTHASTSPQEDSTASPSPASSPEGNGKLRISFIDVGQADSILIQTPDGKSMLIDAGNNADSNLVTSYIKSQGINKLDVLIGTHPHEDHIGGLDAVINNFDVEKIYMPKVTHTTQTYEDVLTAIKNKGLKVTAPAPGTSFDIGMAKCTILAPNSSDYDELNNYSIVLKLLYGHTSFLFTGDAEAVSEQEMLSRGYDLMADVLKIGHHGSNSSTTDAFLSAVSPGYTVISVGKNNVYGHPHKEVMDRLKSRNIPVYRTDENGTIICISDGNTITFNVSPGSYASAARATATPDNTATPKPPDASGDRIVYYTQSGKSYHFSKNCSTLKRSKNILEGKLSDVIKMGKDDPCDICAGG